MTHPAEEAKSERPAETEQTGNRQLQAGPASPSAQGETSVPAAETGPPFEESAASRRSPAAEEPPPVPDEQAADPAQILGPPLVDDPSTLERLHPKHLVWFDKATKSVVLQGVVCQRNVPLELFACLKGGKEHESIVAVYTEAYVVHAGLLAAGAEPGGPAQFYPEYVPARGTEIEITVRWADSEGKVREMPAQQWVRNMKTGKAMEHPWVFAGSCFSEDPQTHRPYYQGDIDGDLICVSNFPGAVLDLPIPSTANNDALLFEAFTEHIPPIGTPVTLILKPKPTPPPAAAENNDSAQPDAARQQPAGKPQGEASGTAAQSDGPPPGQPHLGPRAEPAAGPARNTPQ